MLKIPAKGEGGKGGGNHLISVKTSKIEKAKGISGTKLLYLG